MPAESDRETGTNPDPRWGEFTPTHDPRLLANFIPRPADILITTAPKSGTTWMQQILHQLRTGGDTDFDSIDAMVPWLELPRSGTTWQEQLGAYAQIQDPRIFKTHCTYEQTPGHGTVRIVLSSRDPRDSCVSFYHHVMDMTDEARKRVGVDRLNSFDDVFEAWMHYAAWFRNVKSWWPHINDSKLLWLRYEDMKLSLEDAVDRIIAFLHWDISPEQRRNALEYSSFEWMKKHSDKFIHQMNSGQASFKPGGFIRKGEVGDHKSLLSDAQERRILDMAGQMLEPDCLRFLRLSH